MPRITRLLFTFAMLATVVGVASADVRLRMGVRPDTLTQCSIGHLFTAIGNDGTAPIGVRVCIALVSLDDTTRVFGPFCGRTALAPGETRVREFDFPIGPNVPAGNYTFVGRAMATDGSTARARAPFTVTPSPIAACPPGGDTLESAVLQGMGLEPDSPTPVTRSTWGQLKIRYR